MAHGLFVGLTTLDWIYLTAQIPDCNQKIVALDYTLAAGGPATNSAITFQYLGNSATLLSTIGQHPVSALVRSDLDQHGVTVVDLAPYQTTPLPTSSILVTQSTGERAVVSINAIKTQISSGAVNLNLLHSRMHNIDIVLIDGHQMQVGQEIVRFARARNIPIVIDGGSWKPGFEQVLPYADYVIASANFHPPNCHTLNDTFAYLQALQIPYIALSQGDRPIRFVSRGEAGEVTVPKIVAVDTLGAGDVLHGAFCHYILQAQIGQGERGQGERGHKQIGRSSFQAALTQAATLASRSCCSFGTRLWMKEQQMKEQSEEQSSQESTMCKFNDVQI
jgi:sugar/nucleoside kinase (ribokinase family)